MEWTDSRSKSRQKFSNLWSYLADIPCSCPVAANETSEEMRGDIGSFLPKKLSDFINILSMYWLNSSLQFRPQHLNWGKVKNLACLFQNTNLCILQTLCCWFICVLSVIFFLFLRCFNPGHIWVRGVKHKNQNPKDINLRLLTVFWCHFRVVLADFIHFLHILLKLHFFCLY